MACLHGQCRGNRGSGRGRAGCKPTKLPSALRLAVRKYFWGSDWKSGKGSGADSSGTGALSTSIGSSTVA